VLARWEHTRANGSSTSLQIYDNAIERSEAGGNLSNNALDIDFEYHLTAGSRHDLVWGLDYRINRDHEHADSGHAVRLTPSLYTDSLFAAFIQDEIRLGRSVFLTLGSKVEHNGFTGFEYEPSIQTVWKINDRHSIWASAARAVRQPDLLERGLQIDFGVTPVTGYGPALVTLSGNPAERAEHLNDYEAGYRAQVNRWLSVDLTAFLSFYQHLQTQEPGTPYLTLSSGEPLLIIPVTLANLAHARDYGIELFANWNVTGRWKVSPGYSMLRMSLQPDPSGHDNRIAQIAGYSPGQQFEIRSLLSLRKNIEWDSSLKYVGRLGALNIPGYARLDTRLGWRPGESWELSISGQNLSARRHLEFLDDSGLFLQTEVARTVSVKLTKRF
jgi:iron complex outermembrane receptor protein